MIIKAKCVPDECELAHIPVTRQFDTRQSDAVRSGELGNSHHRAVIALVNPMILPIGRAGKPWVEWVS